MTPPGADSGVDVRAKGALAQVKFEAHQIGRPVLQRLVARGRDVDTELLLFSGAGFSRQAVEYAQQMDIALFKYSLDGQMSPVNSTARQVVSRRQPASTAVPSSLWATLPWKGFAVTCYIVAALFALALITGLFNGENYKSASALLSGLAIFICTVLALTLGNWFGRKHREYA